MKAVPKVNTDGLYLEDELVDDAFSGVVPFYVEPEPPVFDSEAPEQVEEPEDEQEAEPEIAGYIVGVPVPAGLFRPKFDLKAWDAYLEEEEKARTEYQALYEAWLQLPEEEREEAPHYVGPVFPDLWIEGLSQEEIDELTKPKPEEPSELDILKQENILLKAQNAALSERADFIEDVIAEMAAQVYQ
ncbi:hypothetical protein ABIC22_005997 [Paenibacillus sp. PvP094]|uniref:hypothetical protein n=1 Tax=Paenibacillus sp. PvP094 TaxID=3156394 RepID=UPI003391BCA0